MIQVSDLELRYASGFCLQVPQLQISAGAKIAVIGPSGSGKSTFLNILAGVISPDRGQVRIGDTKLTDLSPAQRRQWRAGHIGFVFQEFELLEYLTAAENILLPVSLNLASRRRSASSNPLADNPRERLHQLARAVGIAEKLKSRPHQLSHGERQRVALCRALINRPDLILADEPTGSLDPASSSEAMQLLIEQSRLAQATLLVVTHDHSHMNCFDRIVKLPLE